MDSIKERIREYQIRVDQFDWETQKLTTRILWTGWLRLFLFIGIVICFYQILHAKPLLWYLPICLALLILFGMQIKSHIRLRKERDLARLKKDINQAEAESLAGNSTSFNSGLDFASEESYFDDLDIFGEGSLFQFLNRCGTYSGWNQLAYRLKNPWMDKDTILKHQASVKELSLLIDLRQDMHANGLRSDYLQQKYSANPIIPQMDIEQSQPIKQIIAFTWPVVVFLTGLWWLGGGAHQFFITAFLISFGYTAFEARSTQKYDKILSGSSKLWKQYAGLFDLLGRHTFREEVLTDISEVIADARDQINKLQKLAEAYDRRRNLVIYPLLSGLFLYDYHINRWMNNWIRKNGSKLENWIEQLGKFEVIASLSTFSYNNPDYVFPEFTEQNQIRGISAGHPLIPYSDRVNNDFIFGPDKTMFIITGSNMAGKSTFLRMLGINTILAQIGAPVCAAEFQCRPVSVFSSIRLSDSLQESTSFFYAELKKLHAILQAVETGIPSLVLLDEVLKGTNSDDKIYGAQQLIKKLIRYDGLFFLATHILSLGDMSREFPESIENYCFESTIDGDNLTFDYKIRPGVAVHKNATFLMKKMGII